MSEFRLNYKKILKFSLIFILIMIGILLGLKLAIFFLPFVIAYIIAKIIEKPVKLLTIKFKIPKVISVIICMLLFISIVGCLLYLFASALFKETISLSMQTNYIFPMLYNNISTLVGRFNFFYKNSNLSPELVSGIQTSLLGIVNSLLTSISNIINTAGNMAVNIIVSLPNTIIYVIITLLSTFFISCDSQLISDSLEKHLPLKWIVKFQQIVNDLLSALGGYLKAQGILIVITFTELLIGLSIFRIKYALILAIVIAIIDALPILGTGTVLIPWGVTLLIMGDYKFAFCILGLYLFILIVRQLIEPKIVGNQIGIYPLVTLIAMYAGARFFGIFGVILGPIILVILKNILGSIYKRGSIKELFETHSSLND